MGNKHSNEKFENRQTTKLKNVYGKTLEPCKNIENDFSGSWDSQGLCSEKGGGVHTICINKISKNTPGFSKKTGQSNWSDNRGDGNHCVCLGAWSLYSAIEEIEENIIEEIEDVLKCEAIPDFIFETKYYSSWNTWNGNEKNNQIEHGLDKLYDVCYKQVSNKDSNSKKYLDNKYKKLKRHIKKRKNKNYT